ncbi:MAG TPA: metal ABC transporter permease, partial [Burkholderiales bacterium]|nr:metal ABC transporter permease [Burkholderiales bacterium]
MTQTRAHNAAPTQKLKGNEWRAVGTLLLHLLEYKWRVALALACLISAKIANVGVPLIMKEVVDRLEGATAMVAVPAALLAIYGILRFSATMFGELRDVLFVPVTQRAIRRIALGV